MSDDTATLITQEAHANDALLIARLKVLVERYQPSQFAAIRDEETGEWLVSYPNGTIARVDGLNV